MGVFEANVNSKNLNLYIWLRNIFHLATISVYSHRRLIIVSTQNTKNTIAVLSNKANLKLLSQKLKKYSFPIQQIYWFFSENGGLSALTLECLGIPSKQIDFYFRHFLLGHHLLLLNCTDKEISKVKKSIEQVDVENWEMYRQLTLL